MSWCICAGWGKCREASGCVCRPVNHNSRRNQRVGWTWRIGRCCRRSCGFNNDAWLCCCFSRNAGGDRWHERWDRVARSCGAIGKNPHAVTHECEQNDDNQDSICASIVWVHGFGRKVDISINDKGVCASMQLESEEFQ